MSIEINTQQPTGGDYVASLQRQDIGYWWNNSTQAWVSSQPATSALIVLTEGTGTLGPGSYSGTNATTEGDLGNAGLVTVRIHNANNGYAVVPGAMDQVSVVGSVEVTAGNAVVGGYATGEDPATLLEESFAALPSAETIAGAVAAALGTYIATINLDIDDTDSQDTYTVQWYKDAAPVAVDSSPAIQAVTVSSGATLIAQTAMSAVGSTSALQYSATGDARTTAGRPVLVIATATIDGSTRTWQLVLSRDS